MLRYGGSSDNLPVSTVVTRLLQLEIWLVICTVRRVWCVAVRLASGEVWGSPSKEFVWLFPTEAQPAKVRTMLPMRTFGLYVITCDS